MTVQSMKTVEKHESEVRSYCRSWPVVFQRAQGAWMWDVEGRAYLDFFSGAGALNYGHNHPALKAALVDYIASDGPVHSLDMTTAAKVDLLETLDEVLFQPRGFDYKVQFPGPTGTNAVEAALKLARKVKGRDHIISFTNAFHGMTLGSLSVTGNSMKRSGAGVPLSHSTAVPYCDYMEDGSSLSLLESLVKDQGSGLDRPAAVIVETVQGEGGVNVASFGWLRRLAELCAEQDMLLIVDDIQMGCGRTGPFFSFEPAGITPDIVCLSKSIGGDGLPLALTLITPELDVWEPGEHNGTFRGNNLAFVTAAAALREFWTDDALADGVTEKAAIVEQALVGIAADHLDQGADTRGRGLVQGLVFEDPKVAGDVCRNAFEAGLLVETSGPQSEVVKLMPSLTISNADLERGLEILRDAVERRVGGFDRARPVGGLR